MTEPLRLTAADGYALSGRVFGARKQGPVLVINGATGVHQRYYARFAEWAADRDATVLTWDYRGIGESRPYRLQGFTGTMSDWGRHDFEGVLRFVQREWSGRQIVALGHSVGGQLIGQAASNPLLSRVVTVGSQFGSWNLWPRPRRWAMAGLWYGVMPAVTRAMGYFPGSLGIGADLPKEVALEWARWCRSPEYFLAHGVSGEGYARLSVPLLSFSFSDDTFAPKAAVDALHALYANAQLERRHFSPRELAVKAVGHFGFFRESFRETLWEQLGAFVFREGRPPLPDPLPDGAREILPRVAPAAQ
jgi:predicted alpha/beta hydrolase